MEALYSGSMEKQKNNNINMYLGLKSWSKPIQIFNVTERKQTAFNFISDPG